MVGEGLGEETSQQGAQEQGGQWPGSTQGCEKIHGIAGKPPSPGDLAFMFHFSWEHPRKERLP